MGYITTAVSMDVDLWNHMEKVRNVSKQNRSYFIQSAIRMKIKSIEKQNIKGFLESLDTNEIELLKQELKHYSVV